MGIGIFPSTGPKTAYHREEASLLSDMLFYRRRKLWDIHS